MKTNTGLLRNVFFILSRRDLIVILCSQKVIMIKFSK